MNKKLSKEDLKWEDDSYLMREIHEKFAKVNEKMEQLEQFIILMRNMIS